MTFSLRIFLAAGLWLATGLLALVSLPVWGDSDLPSLAPLEHLRIGYLWLAAATIILALVLRHRRIAIAAALILGLNLALVLPTRQQGQEQELSPAAISLLHANIWYENQKMSDVAAMLNRERPDIAALVEVGGTIQGDWQGALGEDWPHRLDCGPAGCGNLILSRWPLERLDVRSSWHDGPGIPAVLAARVRHPAGDFTLVVAHLSRPMEPVRQQEQAVWLAGFLHGLPRPLVVTGDFNAAPWSPLFHRLQRDGGVTRAGGIMPTWPSGLLNPVGIPIDHLLGSPDIQFGPVRVLPAVGSDHLPLLAGLQIEWAQGPAPLAGEGGGTPRLVPTP